MVAVAVGIACRSNGRLDQVEDVVSRTLRPFLEEGWIQLAVVAIRTAFLSIDSPDDRASLAMSAITSLADDCPVERGNCSIDASHGPFNPVPPIEEKTSSPDSPSSVVVENDSSSPSKSRASSTRPPVRSRQDQGTSWRNRRLSIFLKPPPIEHPLARGGDSTRGLQSTKGCTSVSTTIDQCPPSNQAVAVWRDSLDGNDAPPEEERPVPPLPAFGSQPILLDAESCAKRIRSRSGPTFSHRRPTLF
jgi:hypothetical protein